MCISFNVTRGGGRNKPSLRCCLTVATSFSELHLWSRAATLLFLSKVGRKLFLLEKKKKKRSRLHTARLLEIKVSGSSVVPNGFLKMLFTCYSQPKSSLRGCALMPPDLRRGARRWFLLQRSREREKKKQKKQTTTQKYFSGKEEKKEKIISHVSITTGGEKIMTAFSFWVKLPLMSTG